MTLLLALLGCVDRAEGVTVVVVDQEVCGLDRRGRAVCWGETVEYWQEIGQWQALPPEGRLHQLVGGRDFWCALDADGGAHCWNQVYDGSKDGRLLPPTGSFSVLDAGWCRGCVADAEGRTTCWADEDECGGPLDPPAEARLFELAVEDPAWSCGLDAAGAPLCWGSAANPPGRETPEVQGLHGLCDGERWFCALDAEDMPFCWDGTLDVEAQPEGGPYASIACGHRASCTLDTEGQLACWGRDAERFEAAPEGPWARISLDASMACGVRLDGEVLCWGESERGGLEVPASFP
ncbi:MAG: hypothetical protein H6741_28280 [Alphaproteobacteria bacterium]|nr:hypothetical protein [Alphaproteobacteria bacterium]MCB9796614.1 hypothetical protein [Alphaproteobacteria bacterium]